MGVSAKHPFLFIHIIPSVSATSVKPDVKQRDARR